MKSYIHFYKKNDEFTKAYNGPDYKEPWLSLTEEGMKVNYNKPKLTAITFDSITWVTDVPAKGGTATKDNCEFKVYGNYEDGTSADISSIVTVTGELAVESSTEDQRREVGQLALTASYSGLTATGNVTAYQKADFSTKPLTFNILSAGTINWTASNTAVTKTIKYKLNGGGWTSITSKTGSSAQTINVIEGDKIQFKGNNAQYATNGLKYNSFSGSTASFEVEGNIMSLIYGDDFKNKLTISSNYTFYGLFQKCVNLVSAENLVLPATTLAYECYADMFQGCTSLTTAPELPATTLASDCYYGMFGSCKSLTTAPELPATTLVGSCYNWMFDGCTSLTKAPKLPATTLKSNCYKSMFKGCTSLATAPALPATTLATQCYYGMFQNCTSLTTAPVLPATTLADDCYNGMFNGCTSLTKAPKLPATKLAGYCYSGMFMGCTSLTTAPALPATTLAIYCYQQMFFGCTSLTTAPELPVTTLANNCYSQMFQGCTSLTTAPELPATTLAKSCYYWMFYGCSSLTTAPELPATDLASECYSGMFYGTNVLPDCSNIDFASSTVVASGGLKGLFSGTKVTDNDLERLLPKNDNGRYYLPATTLADSCYYSMFNGCKSLTTAPALPATTLADSCYCNMFKGCTSLTTAPELPATTLAKSCYQYMFYGCSSLNYIKCLATDISASKCTGSWVYGVAPTGTFVENNNMTSWTTGISGIPTGWTVEEYIDYKEPLTFKISSPGTINWMTSNSSLSKTIEYKLNDSSNWLSITSNTTGVTINVSVGDKIQFRGNNATYYTNTFSGSTAGFEIEGNIMSLINSTDFVTATTLQDTNTFRSLFNTCTGLTSAENLVLPATTLAESCYNHMFKNCTSLTTAPALPATTLATYCYSNMFDGCTSLTTAPELPATTLVTYCYNYMFYGCTSLNYIKCLAKNISASKCTNRWVSNVAEKGTFVKPSSMASWGAGTSGIPTGWAVQDA